MTRSLDRGVLRLPLSSGWQLKEHDPARAPHDAFREDEGWLPAEVPGTVHQDLLRSGKIQDPFFDRNEQAVQWVGERDWLYRISFDLREGIHPATRRADLCFDGLDTIAEVWLNGTQVLTSTNMFVPRRVPVSSLLRERANTLWVHFRSAYNYGKDLARENDEMFVWNGDASRVYVRKAQYHYGWDWGPCLITCGIYREVYLEVYEARISEVSPRPRIDPGASSATVTVAVGLERSGAAPAQLAVRTLLLDPEGRVVADETAEAGARDTINLELAVPAPRLWWPAGHGDQPLYTLEASLLGGAQGEQRLDTRRLRLGLRCIELVREPLAGEPGTSFIMAVNGARIFCGGANWIPADSFTPRVGKERYLALLTMAREAHMVMLRVWGGGIYEEDVFYDLCDELGLLVWQDFMFACGIYPAKEWFKRSVREEAEATVRRLRHHACVALWCGNNEDYSIAQSIGSYGPAAGENSAYFPARVLYEELLPEVVRALDPDRPYWPGSPYGGDDANDPTTGDRHTWEVWHGEMADYQAYPRYAGRFVSEFGMQSHPDERTLLSVLPVEEQVPGSAALLHHNKATGGPRRLAEYLSRGFPESKSLSDEVYHSQLMQAEALLHAFRGFRRRFGPPGAQRVAGALVWQLDDCWPVTSWSIIDYALRRKGAYFVVRRELAPHVVGLAIEHDALAIWVVNGTRRTITPELHLRAFTLDGARIDLLRRPVEMPANQAAEVERVALPRGGAPLVYAARLLMGEEVLARAAEWPQPLRALDLPDPQLVLTPLPGERLRLSVTRPAKGVLLSAADEVLFEDNMLDLMPDDERVIAAKNLGGRTPRVRWLRTREP